MKLIKNTNIPILLLIAATLFLSSCSSQYKETMYVFIQQYFENAPSVSLPILEKAQAIFRHAGIGLKAVKSKEKPNVLAIFIYGCGKSKSYTIGGSLYTGAEVYGNISMEQNGKWTDKSFNQVSGGTVSGFVREGKYQNPDDAPFAEAFENSDFYSVVMTYLYELKGLDPILSAITDTSTPIRAAALKVLKEHPGDRAVDAIAAAVLIEKTDDLNFQSMSHNLVEQMVEALGEMKNPRAIPTLLIMLDKRKEPVYYNVAKVEELSLQALAKMSDAQLTDILIGILRHPSPMIRYEAARILGERKESSAVSVLIQFLKDSNKDMRMIAAWALGEIGDAKAVPALKEMLQGMKEDVYRKGVERILQKLN